MKLASMLKISTFCLSMLGSTLVVQHLNAQSYAASCSNIEVASATNEVSIQLVCNAVPQQSWFSWFTGHSRSTQFHFIDLLELLNRFQSAPAAE